MYFSVSEISSNVGSDPDKKLISQTKDLTKDLKNIMSNQNLNNYIKSIMEVSVATNKYINDMEPWTLKKNDVKRMETVIYVALNQIRCLSILLNPIIPISTDKVLNFLNYPNELKNLQFTVFNP